MIKTIEEENLLDRALKVGEKLKRRFLKVKGKYFIVGDVCGMRVMMAIELVKGQRTRY
ncbi:MAG TPA: aminotransferase class III-fold pyridoxal phosphate-dependent enzyme [Candidatus Atribacteria bacterium]|nr:aminotransferase class III-fold pyridoxal phosphate-dependent enzyme [Candidatus Atribacteria bacterium]